VFVTGFTGSMDFPITPGVFDEVGDRWGDAFIVKLGLPLPDLVVRPPDIAFSPAGPVAPGSRVTIRATVHNEGGANVSGVVVRFHDGPPPFGRIDGDQAVPFIAGPSGEGLASVDWLATSPGVHDICVVADPDNAIPEGNETNNEACQALVVASADYTPVDPRPDARIVIGLSVSVPLSVGVQNVGGLTPNRTATLAFLEPPGSSTPFARVPLPPIPAGGVAGPFEATWTAPSTPGGYRVIASADYDGNITEANEGNNNWTWFVEVVPGPVTSLVVGAPNYTATVTYVTSATPLSFSVFDRGGAGIRRTMYRIDGGAWTNFTAMGPFRLAGDAEHLVEWYSEDRAGNVEATQSARLQVDDTPPTTTISPSVPPFPVGTRFILSASDAGSGVNRTEYRIDGGNWTLYTTPFTVPEGAHVIGYHSVDNLGNVERERSLVVPAEVVLPVEFNWKPLVALVFAVLLALAGAWASKRAPWKGIAERKGALTAFALTALPFVLLEVATGVVSLFTGLLSIPPVLGIGTAVDSAILVAGLAVAVYRGVKARPPDTRPTGRNDRRGGRPRSEWS